LATTGADHLLRRRGVGPCRSALIPRVDVADLVPADSPSCPKYERSKVADDGKILRLTETRGVPV